MIVGIYEKDEVLLHLLDSAIIDLPMMLYILMIKLVEASRDGIEFFSKNIVWSKLPQHQQQTICSKDGF